MIGPLPTSLARWSLPVVLGLACSLGAQRGDRKGEAQPGLPEDLVVPPAPVLSPEEALASFVLAPGVAVDLVAAEPLVNDPIAIAFGADAAMWVVEMRGFMPDLQGEGELEPNGRIVVLRDRDGDGRMDDSTVFLDGLVLPRGVAPIADGALVIEPPHLWWCRDTDGDGECDERSIVAAGFEDGLQNPEHAGNGPQWGLDNWIQVIRHGTRFRWTPGGFAAGRTMLTGQWGGAQDDWGRWYYDYNSDQLRADLFPAHYAIRNEHHGRAAGPNHRLVGDQSVWPVRVTPGVNRGYRDGLLADGVLTRYTAACGPMVYRGGLFPADWLGNALVCEPAGNLVRRNRVSEVDGVLSAENAYERVELMASTDERFRPVNAHMGPDGAIYVVDMYRGIVQHRNFVTSFLAEQIVDRGLATPLGLGRIYRLRPTDVEVGPAPDLSALSATDLVARLADPNGWVRDTAQRRLVEQGDHSVVAELRAAAVRGDLAVTRSHALWTLQGLGVADWELVEQVAVDPDARVVVQALRVAETLPVDLERAGTLLQTVAGNRDARVRRQWALSASVIAEPNFASLAAAAAEADCADRFFRGALLSGLQDREYAVMATLLDSASWREERPGRADLVRHLARCIARSGEAGAVAYLLDLAAGSEAPWQSRAVVRGLRDALPGKPAGRPPFGLAHEPRSLVALAGHPDAGVREHAIAIREHFQTAEPAVAALTPEQEALRKAGAVQYAMRCAACHQQSGEGLPGLAPSLHGTSWVGGPPEHLIKIMLHGIAGPLEIEGKRWNLMMPGHPTVTDEQAAAIATFVRRSFGNEASAVEAAAVQKVREDHPGRVQPWTAAELKDGP